MSYNELRENVNGDTHEWVLDGNGYNPENFLSVTITQKDGSSQTYVGKDEIPWGAAIHYLPKRAGAYE